MEKRKEEDAEHRTFNHFPRSSSSQPLYEHFTRPTFPQAQSAEHKRADIFHLHAPHFRVDRHCFLE